MTDHFELSIIIGTREIAGSDAMRFKKWVMQASESKSPSSKLMSIILAPFSTCCKATARAPSQLDSRIIFLNRGEPVTLVRSPTVTKVWPSSILKGSSPLNREIGGLDLRTRGEIERVFSTVALICSGVVPQQPPIILIKPLSAKSLSASEVCSGVSS